MTIVEIVAQFHLFFAETVLLSSFSFSVCRINISFLNVSLFILMDDGEFEKISNRLRSCFYGVLLDNIHSQNLPNIKTCAMTKTDKKVRDPSSISKSKTSTVFLAKKLPYQQSGVEGEGGHLHTHHSVILTQKERQMKKESSDTRA